MKALVICNGKLKKPNTLKKQLESYQEIIAVDGGIRHARALALVPDVVIGDFDSVSDEDLVFIKTEKIKMIKYPSVKDASDTELALDYCLEKGYDEVTIIAFSGSRLDHTMANLTMFSIKSSKLRIVLLDHMNKAFFIHGDYANHAPEHSYISIIPMTPTIVIRSTSGLHYPVTDKEIPFGSTLCISNYPLQGDFGISLSSGTAMLILAQEKNNAHD